MNDKTADAGFYLFRLFSSRYSGVTFPDFAGIDATISGCGKPNEFTGTVLMATFLRNLFVLVGVSVDVSALWKVHRPAARIGTNFFKVFGLQPIGRLLNRLDST